MCLKYYKGRREKRKDEAYSTPQINVVSLELSHTFDHLRNHKLLFLCTIRANL